MPRSDWAWKASIRNFPVGYRSSTPPRAGSRSEVAGTRYRLPSSKEVAMPDSVLACRYRTSRTRRVLERSAVSSPGASGVTLTRRRAFQSRFLTALPVGRCKPLCYRHAARAALERQRPPRTCGDSPANRRAASERHYRKHEGAMQCAKSRSSAASFARLVPLAIVRAGTLPPMNTGFRGSSSGGAPVTAPQHCC